MTSLRKWHKVKVAQGEKGAAKKVVSLTQNMFTSTFLKLNFSFSVYPVILII